MPFQFDKPLRLRILEKLTAILREITPANGYRHDLGVSEEAPDGRVFRGRVEFSDSDPVPMISILETPLQDDPLKPPRDSGLSKRWWDLTIQGFLDDDYKNPTDPAQYLVADVIRRIVVEKKKNINFQLFDMGDDVLDIVLGAPVVRPPDELSAKAYFWLPVSLELAEDLEKPYGEWTP